MARGVFDQLQRRPFDDYARPLLFERVCGTIYELENLQFYKYEGNYSYYLEQKEAREANEAANLHKTKQLFKKELDWMRRTPSARTGKAKDRIDRFKTLRRRRRNALTIER